MKYHKIRGVPIDVCTAEQKIAYNLAFHAHITFGDRFKKWVNEEKPFEIAISDAVFNMVKFEIEDFTRNYSKTIYDIDAIQAALLYGLKDYLLNYFIATSYDAIGKTFPANYLEV